MREELKNFKEEVEKLEENSILSMSNWWGFYNPGEAGTIITKDKKIYFYTFYLRQTPILEQDHIPLESMSDGYTLSDQDYDKIIQFIEQEIKNKSYEFRQVHDSGNRVFGFYKDEHFQYPNCYDSNTGESLYHKLQKLIKSFDIER